MTASTFCTLSQSRPGSNAFHSSDSQVCRLEGEERRNWLFVGRTASLLQSHMEAPQNVNNG